VIDGRTPPRSFFQHFPVAPESRTQSQAKSVGDGADESAQFFNEKKVLGEVIQVPNHRFVSAMMRGWWRSLQGMRSPDAPALIKCISRELHGPICGHVRASMDALRSLLTRVHTSKPLPAPGWRRILVLALTSAHQSI
jgi:hypothetical protein